MYSAFNFQLLVCSQGKVCLKIIDLQIFSRSYLLDILIIDV